MVLKYVAWLVFVCVIYDMKVTGEPKTITSCGVYVTDEKWGLSEVKGKFSQEYSLTLHTYHRQKQS